MHLDRFGTVLRLEDEVVILRLPDGMSDGLPPEEKEFVDSCEGRTAVVDEFPDADHAMVEIRDPVERIIHFLLVPVSDLWSRRREA